MSYQKCTLAFIVVVAAVALESMAAPPQKISGGSDAVKGEFPYHVGVQHNGTTYCGGSIISQYHILTAAQCIKDLPLEFMTVRTGSINHTSGGQVFKALRATVHPKYISSTPYDKHDVGVITLAEPIQFNELQKPIKLASKIYPQGTPAVVTGWGRIKHFKNIHKDTLQKLNLEMDDVQHCLLLALEKENKNDFVCTKWAFLRRVEGVCKGDGGGALVVGKGDEREVVGIPSFTIYCGFSPDGYTSVLAHKKFIEDEMKNSPK